MTEYRGHQFTIDRAPYWAWGAPWRTIRVPSLGICEEVWGTLVVARESACHLIDAHLREHGHGPEEKTAEERAETRNEVYGRF